MDTFVPLDTEPYQRQISRWPNEGRHVLAQYDDASIIVYQAYKPSIASFAVTHQHFGDEFSFSRMSWVKPNFLWMMYRCGWGTKESQERVLALRIRRSVFDAWLLACVPSAYDSRLFSSRDEWRLAVQSSDVRLQWDPDHDPAGTRVARRALQLGLRGASLSGFGKDALLAIYDISDAVACQRANSSAARWSELLMPREEVYPVPEDARIRLGVD